MDGDGDSSSSSDSGDNAGGAIVVQPPSEGAGGADEEEHEEEEEPLPKLTPQEHVVALTLLLKQVSMENEHLKLSMSQCEVGWVGSVFAFVPGV